MPRRNTISRVILRNYKSIRHCDVTLGPITFLVGPNGSGKSNFLEALRFLSYALSNSLERAIDNRLGFRSMLTRGIDRESTISFEIYCHLGDQRTGSYLVEISVLQDGPVRVVREECSVQSAQVRDWFKVSGGVVSGTCPPQPPPNHTLMLTNASRLPAFEPIYRALSSVAVYNPIPDEIRGFKSEKQYRNLDRTGSTLAQTVFRLKTASQERLARVTEYLRKINPGVVDFNVLAAEANYMLRFEFDLGGGHREIFSAQQVSDGTVRALAVLVALFQTDDRSPLSLIGVEEPEAGLHPAAASVLFDSLMEASQFHQIVVTSHSPDLLDREDIPEDSLKAVVMRDGRTVIGEVDESAKTALRERLYTAGELMRMDQLRPEEVPDPVDAR